MAEGNDPDVGPSPPENQPVVDVVLAGKSGAGKSTLFYKLLGEKKKVPLSAKPVTQHKESRHYKGTEGSINLIDTLGFIDGKISVKDVEKKFDLLVYCIPVNPGAKFMDFNPTLIKRLHSIYGQEVWNHCVVVFTFSNQALGIALNDEEYMKYISQYAREFQKELKNGLKVKNVDVQPVFTQDIGPERNPNVIPAIPAGYKTEDAILPEEFPGEKCKDWPDKIYHEMIKKCRGIDKKYQLGKLKYGAERAKELIQTKIGTTITAGAAGAATFAATGAVIGAIAGIPGGLAGMGTGATVGARIGSAIGVTLVGGGAGMYCANEEIKERKKKKEE